MADSRTVRVLSFDGGGMWGYYSNRWFSRFVNLWGISPDDVWKYFDVIAGTSIGGIQALALAYGLRVDDLALFFTNDGPWIFTIRSALDVSLGSINASFPSNRPYTSQKIAILGQNDQFYRSVDPASNYGSSRLKRKLDETFGTNTLQDLKTNVLIPSYKSNTDTPVFFSNLNYGELSGQNELISNVALTTSAAPLYLPPVTLGSNVYIDGGVVLNNPADFALKIGKMIKPTANRYCVLSIGTGLGKGGFDEEENPNLPPPPTFPFESTIKSLVSIIDASTTGAQETVARGLFLLDKYTLDNYYEFREQMVRDPSLNTDLDSSDPATRSYMDAKAQDRFNENIDDITTFLGHLTA
jgi:hypothetical protein